MIKYTIVINIILILFLAPSTIFSQDKDVSISDQDWRSSVIRDPSLSAKCKRMINQRFRKIRYKQKIQSLLVRNTELVRQIPKKKKSIIANLQKNYTRLQREKELNLLKIRVLTENIIKKGCPSIDF